MKIIQTPIGYFINDKEVIEITLINDKGTLVKLFNYGTIINQFIITNKFGEKQDIVLGFDKFEDYISEAYLANYPYLGAIIGRYANRIKDGKFSIGQETYHLAQNNGKDCLHGGLEGFDKKVWDIIATNTDQHAGVTLQYFSLDGEEGFPGDLAIQLTFELTNNDELILTYTGDTDETTPINLTHHSYFNLSRNGGNIADHIHQMHASNYLEQDDNFVVTGNIIPVKNTMHDFTIPKKIGLDWDTNFGYDQTYVLDKNYGELTLATKTCAIDSGLALLVYTTEPVAHLYTAKYLNVKNGKNGKNYSEFDAICIETQHHPNAINIEHFPDTLLQPNESYSQTTIYKVIVQ